MRLRLRHFLHPIRSGKSLYAIIKHHVCPSDNPMMISPKSEFASQIRRIISEIRPTRIIETGTYLGTGSTFAIASTLRKLKINDVLFFTIEVNPKHYEQALMNLRKLRRQGYVIPLNGLSIPRTMLPSLQEIELLLKDIPEGIFVDHSENQCIMLYYRETDFSDVADDLLGACLKIFNYRPQFVLLDSAGHIGNIEFNYLLGKLKGECYIALDDIYHIKHYKSFLQIQSDPRFEIVVHSKEKFGFTIAKFNPIRDDGKKS